MNSIKMFSITLLSINLFVSSLAQQLNGRCGYPGKPYRARLEPLDYKLQYDEGEVVTYHCTDFWSNIQTRKCVKGKWTGNPPRCGDFVTGIVMKDSRTDDISDPTHPKNMFEHLNMKLIERPWKFPNAFTSNRFPKARLKVTDSKRYKWSFHFTGPSVKLFVRINFNFINFTLLPQNAQDNHTFNISIYVGPNRKCQLTHQYSRSWLQKGRLIENDFICDSISPEHFKRDISDPGDYLYMETQSSVDIHHYLIGVFLGKSYGTEVDPLCGEPEISFSHNSRFNVRFKDYTIDCKGDKYVGYSDMKNTQANSIPKTKIHVLKCGPDMKWQGSYPDCLPIKPCSLEKPTNFNKNLMTSLDGLYFYNESVYYAVEGTELNYGCKGSSSHVLSGKKQKKCKRNGLWEGSEPFCIKPSATLKFSVWIFMAVLCFGLLVIFTFSAILLIIYFKCIKRFQGVSHHNDLGNNNRNNNLYTMNPETNESQVRVNFDQGNSHNSGQNRNEINPIYVGSPI